MKTFREYLAEAKVEKEVVLVESKEIKSKMIAMTTITKCIELEKDEKIKIDLQAILEFMSREFKLPLKD